MAKTHSAPPLEREFIPIELGKGCLGGRERLVGRTDGHEGLSTPDPGEEGGARCR